MRLSLRTLLAFEDNIFDIEQQRQFERTIPHNETATQAISRIRNAVRDPYQGVPGIVDHQEELDPNIVAEYLDHQMSPEYLDQFENFCFSNDKYLAEVASVHQVISNVLGEPARTNRECRFRCYDLFPSIRQGDWGDQTEICEEEQSILKLKGNETSASFKTEEHDKTYRFNIVTGEKKSLDAFASVGKVEKKEHSDHQEKKPDSIIRKNRTIIACILATLLLFCIVVLTSIAKKQSEGSKNEPISADIQIIPISTSATTENHVPLARQLSNLSSTENTLKELNTWQETPSSDLPVKLPETQTPVVPNQSFPGSTQNLSGFGVSDPFAVAMKINDSSNTNAIAKPLEEKKPIQDNKQTSQEKSVQEKNTDADLFDASPAQPRMEPLEPLRKPKHENQSTEGASFDKTQTEKNNPLRNIPTTSDFSQTETSPIKSGNEQIITPVVAVTQQDISREPLLEKPAFSAPEPTAFNSVFDTEANPSTQVLPENKKRIVDEASINFQRDPPVEAKVSFQYPDPIDSVPKRFQPTSQIPEKTDQSFKAENDENEHEIRRSSEINRLNEQEKATDNIASMSRTLPIVRETTRNVSIDRITINSTPISSSHLRQNPVATASLTELSNDSVSSLKQSAINVEERYSRNASASILPVVGISEQKKPDFDTNISNAKSQLQPQKPDPVNRVLGRVLSSNEATVLFSAASANAPWKMEQGTLDLYAEQYLLTATPFRSELELSEDFQIEMIGDSKLCIMPIDENGIPGIFLDYGRLVIRTKNNFGVAGSRRIKSLRIRTERSEGIVTISGPKSLVFIDTFAEVVETTSEKISQENELVPQTGPILGLLPDPTESVSWTFSGRNVPYVANRDTSFLLDEGRYDHGAIKHHPNWIRRISLPSEGLEIESACRRIFHESNGNCETALHIMIRDPSLAVRSFGLRLWGDLGRFDIPLSVLNETKEKNEPINGILTGYFRDVMKRDEESIQRLADAIQAVRR